jgi:hypothetical protein
MQVLARPSATADANAMPLEELVHALGRDLLPTGFAN